MVPFSNDPPASDNTLIEEALEGNKTSLTLLIKRHQAFIYNVSLKMFLDPDDAMDATQEVLIKMFTRLNTFQQKSQFRTWLYRIAVNHFLNVPRTKTELLMATNSETMNQLADEVDDSPVSEAEIEEVRILCATAMLMCLTREQRLLYIPGEVFGTDHQLGAQLFDLTPANYRVRLHRAKADLLNFVGENVV